MGILASLRNLFGGRPGVRMSRRFPRLLMTEGTIVVLPGERREPVKLANVSAGGARIRASFPLPINERIALQVPLGAGARCTLPAHVVYCRRDPRSLHYYGGLNFVGAEHEGIPQVAAFIEEERRRRVGNPDPWRG